MIKRLMKKMTKEEYNEIMNEMGNVVSGAMKCAQHAHSGCINKNDFKSVHKRIVGQVKSLLKRYVENSEDETNQGEN